ncbi:mitochondrial fission ELM1 family protein [Thiohalobacter sp. IOR34]|uniref:mitochondrial fission ELM1 family protein n=1 Tax=Thiohalobacter sp. IOR34 TaxID=3057176 RepID=UPI0025AEE715|nr:mitochondrial fission ELM1 family protein [Thiohalobacter sp. IOR34]WJW75274.1 mitochondrial fission ELM1 family protein [Thiohalobacter sp. IOR34]
MNTASSCRIWRFLDGKPGHENQTAGLLAALAERLPVEVHELEVPPAWQSLVALLSRRFPPGARLPGPDLLLGAGHATHVAMLAARRARGGRIIVLMKPSLPLGLFDLCLIPEHDDPPQRANVIATRGVLNRVRPAPAKDPRRGLLLIGGPSRHFGWDAEALLDQIEAVLGDETGIGWRLCTSRRTPESFIEALQRRLGEAPRLALVRWQDVDRDWLPVQLGEAARVWVTPDSVSMVYEALTAGAAVGLFDLPGAAGGRIQRGLARLEAEGLVTPFADWQAGALLRAPAEPFNEAARCAREIVGRGWCRG